MSTPIVRLGDVNNAGGAVVGPGAPTVLANGIPVSLLGDRVSAHAPCPDVPSHCGAVVAQGSGTVFAESQSVSFVGATESCGHSRATGSPSVLVGT